MNKQKRKGFTIVELVIVIAVIAILSAVMIPTFANITDKANESAAAQKARNVYVEYIGDQDDGAFDNNVVIEVDGYQFKVDNGSFKATALTGNNKVAWACKISKNGATIYLAETHTLEDDDAAISETNPCTECNAKA